MTFTTFCITAAAFYVLGIAVGRNKDNFEDE